MRSKGYWYATNDQPFGNDIGNTRQEAAENFLLKNGIADGHAIASFPCAYCIDIIISINSLFIEQLIL